MAVTLNASSTAGFVTTADTSTILQLQTNGTTAVTVDASQRVAFVAGTAALPAITTTGDTNTGIFFPAADTIAFSEGGAEAMRLDSSGDVNLYNAKSFKVYNPANTRYGSFFTDGNGTNLSSFNGSGEPLLLNAPTGYMNFQTNGSERARIDSSGNLLVGTTTKNNDGRLSISADSATHQGISIKDLNGANNLTYILFTNSSGNTAGSILHSGSTTVSYNTSSDYRLKENIAPMTGALAKVGQLKPVTYTWKEDGKVGQGFIAHELQEVVPDCVTGEKDGIETYTDEDGNQQTRPKHQGIDTSFLVATLTAAIQEQQAIIESQSVAIESLKARLDAANL